MTIGIAGLGLIGGSFAKAYKKAGAVVYGADSDAGVRESARLSGAVDGVLSGRTIGSCDCVLIALSPEAAAAWLEKRAKDIPPGTLVMDCCGTKRRICGTGFRLAKRYGFEFAGGHPMAGTHLWGFQNSRADLFKGASFIAVPRAPGDTGLLERIRSAVLPAGFGSVVTTTAEEHDRIVAFTSQLAHLISSAYIKSPAALLHRGFSAGSYRDLTRVARLNPGMWSELFLENRDYLLTELDTLLASLQEYKNAVASGDKDALWTLLDDGRRRKEEVDGI